MKRTHYLTLIGALFLAVLTVGCATQRIISSDQEAEVSQYPAPGGDSGQVEIYTGSDAANSSWTPKISIFLAPLRLQTRSRVSRATSRNSASEKPSAHSAMVAMAVRHVPI